MNCLWSVLESTPDAAAALNWRRWFGSSFNAAAAACLRAEDRVAMAVACIEGCGCGHRVVRRADAFAGICDCGEECEDIPLSQEDVRVLQFDMARLGRGVASALGLHTRMADVGMRRTMQVASFGNAPLPIILTLQSDEEGFRNTVGHLVARFQKGFILLAPTSRFCTAVSSELLAKVNAGFFDLESNLTLLPSGKLQACKSGAELFAKYLPQDKEALTQSEAVRVFALLQKLKSKQPGMKAPLYDVFVGLILEGLSQRKVAKKCECSLALIAERARALEREFNLPLKQLMNFARPILEMQTAVKGDQRRGRKRGSDPGAFADDCPDGEESDGDESGDFEDRDD